MLPNLFAYTQDKKEKKQRVNTAQINKTTEIWMEFMLMVQYINMIFTQM